VRGPEPIWFRPPHAWGALHRRAGLATSTRDANRHLYVINTDALTAVRSYLDDFWPTRLSALKAAVEAHPEAPKAQEAQETRDAQHD